MESKVRSLRKKVFNADFLEDFFLIIGLLLITLSFLSLISFFLLNDMVLNVFSPASFFYFSLNVFLAGFICLMISDIIRRFENLG